MADLRELADSRHEPAITTLDNLLVDPLVHVQEDVALPSSGLGVAHVVPAG